MNWHVITAWAYGFFTPALAIGWIVLAVGAMALFFELPEKFNLPAHSIWSGVFLFVGLAVVSCVIVAQILK